MTTKAFSQNYVWMFVVITALAGCVPSCRQRVNVSSRMPVQEIDWTGTTGFREWGQTDDGFFGISVESRALLMWKWTGETMARGEEVELPDVLDVIVLPRGEYLAHRSPASGKGPWSLTLASLVTNEIIQEWPPPKFFGYGQAGSSQNRKFVAVMLKDDISAPAPDYDWDNPCRRIGLLGVASKELRWVMEHRGRVYGDIRRVTSSNDGKYIAIAGWENGIAVFDIDAGAMKWFKKPKGVVNFGKAEFSSDGETLYAGDTGGGTICAFEAGTGNLIQTWCATATGKSIYGQRISSFAISPDGTWLAAGTGPTGDVFLFDLISTETKPIILPHGLSTMDSSKNNSNNFVSWDVYYGIWTTSTH